MAISNDTEFKAALSQLSSTQQRLAAARFAEHVLTLSSDARLKAALAPALNDKVTNAELTAAQRVAKAASVESYTQCGHACDWSMQATHFIAEAVLDCVAASGSNPAWDAAMHARMAYNCNTIAAGSGTGNEEAAAQYQILAEILNH